MRVSLIITTYNEILSIADLLDTIATQTQIPYQIIIVDGGSTDGTQQHIKQFQEKHSELPLIFVQKKGNISKGRNTGIKMAKGDIIALTDAGCTLSKNWTEELVKPFLSEKVDVVAGYYEMVAKSNFQKALAPFLGITKNSYNKSNFLPSARSIAFKKKIWNDVGGFSEILSKAGEDTLFNFMLVQKKIPIAQAPKAIVKWTVPETISEAIRKFYFYAKGDAQTGIWWHPAKKWRTHNIKIVTVFARYLLFLIICSYSPKLFISTFFIYMIWSILKLRKDVAFPAIFWIPIIQIMSDLSVMSGFLSGIIRK